MEHGGRKWGIKMFIGEYHHNLDDKGRLIIPSKFRCELGEQFIITRGLDKCLFIYSMNEWNNITNKLKALPFTKKDARNFMRFFLSGATICDLDRQGRININAPLMEYANLSHECVIIGVNERLEVWDKDSFDNFLSVNEEAFSEISEHLFDGEENA